MNDGGVCKTAPATPGLLTSPIVSEKETEMQMQKYLESLLHGCILRGPLQFVGRNFEQSPH